MTKKIVLPSKINGRAPDPHENTSAEIVLMTAFLLVKGGQQRLPSYLNFFSAHS